MSQEVKSLFPVLSPIMSASFHPPVATISPNSMAISLLFGDFSIELNNKISCTLLSRRQPTALP